ncbi:MAG: flavodoxin family protein, partial [Oscillospiraceae bacterium]|nr:flavodoxin family protein [Oscillospiraceae bacterium]
LYSPDGETAYDRKLEVGFIYTMNVEDPARYDYDLLMRRNEETFNAYIGETRTIFAADTYQFSDYTKYASGIFDPEHKRDVRERRFPEDCARAFELGAGLVEAALRR